VQLVLIPYQLSIVNVISKRLSESQPHLMCSFHVDGSMTPQQYRRRMSFLNVSRWPIAVFTGVENFANSMAAPYRLAVVREG
jgi:hypothetical protein